jgi:hypothetical protein
MKTLVSAVSTASLVLGADIAYAGGPGWHLSIPMSYWMDLVVILLILNLVCCWRKR